MRSLLPRFCVAALLGAAIFSLSMELGSADGDIGDKKLEAFISAALAVDDVMDRWQPRIIQAETEQQADVLHSQANAEIRATIENADGISLGEYQELRQAIAADPGMFARVTEMMRQQQQR